jgi:hypothetical protein
LEGLEYPAAFLMKSGLDCSMMIRTAIRLIRRNISVTTDILAVDFVSRTMTIRLYLLIHSMIFALTIE